jgi:fructokinase
MKTVICFGEALIDFINVAKHNSDITSDSLLTLNDYRQFPGGAPANAAVAVAKLGGKAFFSGQVGQDNFGDFLEHALKHYKVDTRYLLKHGHAKTALAFVTLDNEGERSFSFYRDMSADVLLTKVQLQETLFSSSAFETPYIFHFCSNTLTTTDIANTTLFAVEQARKQNALISFDVNLRHNLWSTEQADIALVNQFVHQADVLKFSLDELVYLSQGAEQQYITDCLNQHASLVLVTDGGNDIAYYTEDSSGVISPPTVKVVDTTAGGDGFVGGLLFALSQSDFSHSGLATLFKDEQRFHHLLQFASACGACAVAKQGAFPALPSFAQVTDFLVTVNQRDAANLLSA